LKKRASPVQPVFTVVATAFLISTLVVATTGTCWASV